MNKELIERLALEAYEKQMNQELRPQDKPGVFGVCEEFLSAVDAERRKEAACWQFQDTDGSWHYFVDERHKENTIAAGYPVRPLFLAPQPVIPEGMALVPIDIHPLDGTERNGVAALLCNSPEVLRDQDPTDYYAYWWGLLCAAAGVAP